jgi:hypothetical protein
MFDAIPDCSDCGPSFEDAFPIASKWRRNIVVPIRKRNKYKDIFITENRNKFKRHRIRGKIEKR